MKILAIDSTTTYACVSICEDERLLGNATVSGGNTHSEILLPLIDDLLRSLHLSPKNIDLFALSAGPGSFTGVRIGAATVKGLAFGQNKPCVPVSSLLALAENLKGLSGILCPMIDARRKQVYNALFRYEGGNIIRLTEDRLIPLADLAKELTQLAEPVYLCGDVKKEALGEFPADLLSELPFPLSIPGSYGLSQAALRIYREALASGNEETFTDSALVPDYLRPCQAERDRTEQSARLYGV